VLDETEPPTGGVPDVTVIVFELVFTAAPHPTV